MALALHEFNNYAKTLKSPAGGANGQTAPVTDNVQDVRQDASVHEGAEVPGKGGGAHELQAQIKNRLAALAGPYKEAVANNGPNAQELRDLFGSVRTNADKHQYDEAAKALGSLEHLLDQKPKPSTPGLPGMDTGQVQAFGVKDIPFVGDAIDKVKNEITGSRKVTIIIRNKSDKVLRLLDKKKYGSDNWKPGPPLEIEAAKKGKPGEATVTLETSLGAWGKWVKDFGGELVYQVVDDDKGRKVK
jgi:hypothetical protein